MIARPPLAAGTATILIEDTSINGVTLIQPEPIPDERGWYLRVFSADIHGSAGIDHMELVQENQMRSWRGAIRGLHMRSELSEAKLVRCAHGKVFDVVVDLRPWSPSFLRWQEFLLDDQLNYQVYIPPGCAHGVQALSEVADICYRVDAFYDPELGVALVWNDPELAIPWPIADPILSDRDRAAPTLAEIRPLLEEWYGERDPGR